MNKWNFYQHAAPVQMILAVLTAIVLPLYSLRPLVVGNQPAIEQRRVGLKAYYRSISRPYTDREIFARLADRAALTSGGNVDAFLDDMSWLIIDAPDSRTGVLYAPAGRALDALHSGLGLTKGYPALMRFGSSGFKVNDKSNQVQHFWFSVILSYHLGASFADGMARYHEWNAPGLLALLPLSGHGRGSAGDLRLSRQAIWLGQALRSGEIRPDEVKAWIRSNL